MSETRPTAQPTAALCAACDRARAQPTRPLTPREEEVARLLVAGRSRREIARALGCAEMTVRDHIDHIAAKLPDEPDQPGGGDLTPRDRVLVWAYWEYRAA